MRDKSSNAPLELEKERVHIIVEIIEYVPNAVVSRTIIKKTTGNVTAISFDAGEVLEEKSSPFDTFVQIIDGEAELNVRKKIFKMKVGEAMTIPAHSIHSFSASQQFKMISTVIKSGYED